MADDSKIAILKSQWTRLEDGRWGIHALKGMTLKPTEGSEADFFTFENEIELMTDTPPKNIHEVFTSFGTTNFLLKQSISDFRHDIYVSVGEVFNVLPENHFKKEVRTPGPCFEFRAKIPGKMSGGPILGAKGAVVRGVVSSSFSRERHGFGSMLGPMMHLPLIGNETLRSLMESGHEGIAKIQGVGL